MAQDIIIRTWCDPCLAEDEHNEGRPYPLAGGYVVDVCEVHRKPLDDITAHARRAETPDVPGLACPTCGKVYRSERGLRKHRTQQHGDDTVSGPEGLFAGPATVHACSECGRVFGGAQGLAMHRFRAHGLRSETAAARRQREATATPPESA